ncbi:MAG: hypothetical protein ACRDJC_19575 [Thermomicrobiales bacterium]
MDSERFDSLVRSLPPSGNRRGALAALLGGALAALSLTESAAKKKNMKKKKCGCRGGRKHLTNGSCAKVCADESDCALICACGLLSVEGERHCASDFMICTQIPQSCSTTAQCPLGQYCLAIAGFCGTNRCLPLCG